MAQCPYTRYIRSYDAYSGEQKIVAFGCGRCAVCLHNEQDAWSIRIQETAKAYGAFIYDTLTVRDSVLLWDSPDVLSDPDYIIHKDVERLLRKYDGCVPVFPKSYVSAWLKRGRDALASKYGRENVHLKYIGFMEYGPKWSRPHVHILVFGVSWADYCHYFRNPWRDMFGFTKSKYICKDYGKSLKDIQCISRYVSKYCSKGQFESPLVKSGLIFKPWHVVSHGIGEEYLDDQSKFGFISQSNYAKSLRTSTSRRRISVSTGLFQLIDSNYRSSNISTCPPLPFTKDNYSKLCLYCDDSGYKHALPRYYREKLLGRVPNLLKYEVQNHLLEDACERRNKEVQTIASGLRCRRACVELTTSDKVVVHTSVVDLAWDLYITQQFNKSKMALLRYKDRMRNQYFRPKHANFSSVILNQ